MHHNTTFYAIGLAVLSLVLAILTYRSAFKEGKPVCDRRVLNTYLYVFTMISMLFLFSVLFLPWVPVSFFALLALVVLEIASFLAILFLDGKLVLAKHIALAVWILTSGYLYALLVKYTNSNVLLYAIGAVLAIFVLLTAIAYRFEDWLLESHKRILYTITLVALIAYIIMIFVLPPRSHWLTLIAGALVLLITASVAYKAKDIKNKECNSTALPDYPKDAASILIDLRVLFNLIVQLLAGRRRRLR